MNWRRLFKRMGAGVAALVVIVAIVATYLVLSFGRAVNRVYQVSPVDVVASADSAVIERGRHLAESRGCSGCHGPGFEGSSGESFGPIGGMSPSNLTTGRGGVGGDYTDGLLARAVRHGIGADGRTLLFMPTVEFSWWPDSDLAAIVSYWRTLPPVDNEFEPLSVQPLGMILERLGVMQLMSASQVDHDAAREEAPSPEPTARYGQFLARRCTVCHGERLSGGSIPGAPSSLATPANLTPHQTGLGDWTQPDFVTLLNTGRRPDGSQVDPFMGTSSTRAMNDLEKAALWAYLRSIEPLEFGNR